MALITLLGFIPTLLLSVPAGVLADKYDRRLLMILGDGLSAFGVVFILICMLNGGASLFQICVGVFISAVFSSLLEPSYRATITDLLTKDEFSKASGLVSLAGLFIFGFGIFENIIPITIFGFLFFAMLPFANNSLDYLTRTNIPDELQGRVWGLIGFISQLGYVVAYAISGVLADSIGSVVGSVGRGAAVVIEISGFVISILIPKFKSLKDIEKTN